MTARTRSRFLRRLLGAGALAAALTAAGAGVASAHVTVSAPQATPGGSDVLISFRVPDESESARTVGLKVRLPTDTPIASVLVQPKAGWSATVSRTKLSTPIKTDDGDVIDVVSEIDWKVNAGAQGIGPGQFDDFTVLAGQLPKADSLTFKMIQSYSDGSSAPWIEEPAPGSSVEPEHPAAVLDLSTSSAAAGNSESGTSAPADAASKASAVTGIALGALGVLLGLAALALALRRRQGPSRTTVG